MDDPRPNPAATVDQPAEAEPAEPGGADFGRLVELVRRLRAPDGCPWDRKQTLADVRAYLLEEAHEAAAAIDAGDLEALAGELGDLLFQAAFVARLGEEAGAFTAAGAIERSLAKMIARHPHVFGGEKLADAAAVARAWERRKLEEKGADGEIGAAGGTRSLLDGVPTSLPALTAAYRMTQKAAAVDFDWPDAAAVLAKIDEELAELRAELAASAALAAGDRAREEIGDLLFTVANLARKLGLDPEAALAAANAKFRRRFRRVEQGLAARGHRLGDASLDELEALWEAAKRALG